MPAAGTATRKMKVPQMIILSTNGSRMRPRVVTWPYLRAQYPSSQSVEAAMRNKPVLVR